MIQGVLEPTGLPQKSRRRDRRKQLYLPLHRTIGKYGLLYSYGFRIQMIWFREIDAIKMIIVQLFGFMCYCNMTIFLDIVQKMTIS